MELSSTPTEPSVRTVLKFNKNELLDALVMYAKKGGYEIGAGKMNVWHPSDHPSDDNMTKLVIDAEGGMEPLIKKLAPK